MKIYLYEVIRLASAGNDALTERRPQLYSTVVRRLNGFIDDSFEIQRLKCLQCGMRGAIRAGDILAQLSRWVGRFDKHLASSKARLRSQPGGLLFGHSQFGCTGNQMLSHGEEICRSRSWSALAWFLHFPIYLSVKPTG